MSITRNIPYPVQEIARRIAEGQTQQQIADDLSKTVDPRITAKLIYKVCKKHGIACQRTGPRAGEGHPEWKGGRIVDKNGYIHVFVPDHPECRRVNESRRLRANGKYYRKEKYIQEHRLVMEKHLGRYLLPTEVVHHRNGNRADNHIDNLELFDSNGSHLAETLSGKCPKWTDSGLLRIRASALMKAFPEFRKYSFQRIAVLLRAIQEELELDVAPSKADFLHWIEKRGTTIAEACEKVLGPEPQQNPA